MDDLIMRSFGSLARGIKRWAANQCKLGAEHRTMVQNYFKGVNMQSSLIGLGGALIGILLGHFLARSSQHKQWLRDCRREEFREVISAMSAMVVELILYIHSQETDYAQPKSRWMDAQRTALTALIDRIYIEPELSKLDLTNRFLRIGEEMRSSGASEESMKQMSDLINETVKIARVH